MCCIHSKGGNDKKVILIVGKSYYEVDVDYKITRLQGKEDMDGNRKVRDYEEVQIDRHAVPFEFAEALCYGIANYRANTVSEENIYMKSNVYFGKKLTVHEFFVKSNREIFNEEFNDKLSFKTVEKIKAMKIELPKIDSYDHKYLTFCAFDVSNEDESYIFKKIVRKTDFYSEELDYEFYPFMVRNTLHLLKVKNEDCKRELCDYDKVNNCMITHRLIRLNEDASMTAEDILALASCFMIYGSSPNLRKYDEYKFKIYYGNKLLVEEY